MNQITDNSEENCSFIQNELTNLFDITLLGLALQINE